MPRYAWNKSAPEVKARYFELIRQGWSGSRASLAVGVSLSCGSNWFIDAGSVNFIETKTSSRFLSQNDRIEIAASTVYREIARNTRPDGKALRPFEDGLDSQPHFTTCGFRPTDGTSSCYCANLTTSTWPCLRTWLSPGELSLDEPATLVTPTRSDG